MKDLKSIIRFICHNYPHSHELSNARLTKMVYLADWEFSKRHGKQLTDIQWFFNNYGPYVDDVLNAATSDTMVNVVHTTTMYGTPKVKIEYTGDDKDYSLSKEATEVIEYVIENTKQKYWNSFIKYVYETYPIKINPRYSDLDLVGLATAEKKQDGRSL